ncbi:ABC transporter substrate-binding protein [Sporosarcina sp. P37]|uniref:ABC transporter substrate-binding protein n=1 Tax=unclassified Sporosarcina TaxID=2647733 RepID=UPI0009BCB367|nr:MULTISPECIES: ABC transporter substrate-binding protein [unclassified Sporosarcina]ARD49689.1 peptide ABC transporter substrate-binding protein [Sporosarcina sp. P33]ARK26251.1 ABC transporter substrate-binding protein [Sporosarcina sp. P37]PID20088.1 ABC transporter substrate-binding protein [Sporosarcina sp. P35]
MSMLAGLLLLGACSNDNEKETGAPKEEGNKKGGSMIYARGADSVGLDPINITDGESIRVTHAIFETLFEYDKDLQLQPKLAESYETSEDGLTWTLSLKTGVKFHDGTDFNADAVVFNFERWMDPDNEYHIGDFPYYPFLYGGFKGEENHKIEHVKAVDEQTVEIKLKEKIAPFVSYLAIPMFGIASPAAIEQYNERFFENPVGTGPFVFDSWTRNDKIVVKANENYYIDNQPMLDQIIFTVVPDNSTRLNVLLSGEADFIDGMNPEDAKTIEDNENLELVKRPSFNEGFMVMNTQKKPFDDVKVRQAINMAIDKQSLVDGFYSGFADVAKNPIPPSLWGYNDEIEDYAFDAEAAKELLAEAGYPDGFETEIWTMNNPRPYLPQPMKTAEAIQANLQEIGVKAKIVTYEWATYLEKTGEGQHPMALFGWTGVMADPDNFLYPNLSNTNMKPPANNLAFYDNKEFQNLIEQARVTFEENERIDLYKKAQEVFHEDAPWVPLAHTTPPIGFADYVKGFEPHPMENDNYAVMYLDK